MSLLRIIGAVCFCGAIGAVGTVACSSSEDSKPSTGDPTALPGESATYANDIAEGEALNAALDANPADSAALGWQERYNARADKRAGLFLTLDVAPGHQIKFYEPGESVKLITEINRESQKRVLTDKGVTATFASAYQAARPGEAVPKAVLDADERTRQTDPMLTQQGAGAVGMEPVGNPERLQGGGEGLVEKHATTCVHFEDGHGGCPVSDAQWCVCNPPMQGNWGPSGFTNITHSFHAVAPTVGNILLTLVGGNTTHGPFSVSQGQHFAITVTSNQTCNSCGWLAACQCWNQQLTHTAQVHNAATDTYFWGACFDADQTFHCP